MKSETGLQTLQDLARSRVYACLASWFRYPDTASWESLASDEGRASFREACTLLSRRGAYRSLKRHRGGFPADRCGSLEAWEDLYQATFGHTVSKEFPPYETEYGHMHLFQQTDFLADLAGFYRAFGVDVKERADRADHIAAELEFMHLLTFKEAHARDNGQAEGQRVCREAQISFLEDHLARWAGLFADRLFRRHPDTAYGTGGAILSDFIRAETAAHALAPETPADVARGESLPEAAEDWDSADWMEGGIPAINLKEGPQPCP